MKASEGKIMFMLLGPQEIRQLRQRLGMSTREFAKELGVSQAAVSRWEDGLRQPRPKLALKLKELHDRHSKKNGRHHAK